MARRLVRSSSNPPEAERGCPRSHSRASNESFQDPRRAVGGPGSQGDSFKRQISPEELKAPLPVPQKIAVARPPPPASSPELAVLLGRLWCGLGGRVASICQPKLTAKPQEATPPPRRWYRVHPISDTQYFVRPDAAFRGRIPGYENTVATPTSRAKLEEAAQLPVQSVRSKLKSRSHSLPPKVERGLGLQPESMLPWGNTCKICYDRQSNVVLLPCRHSGMCEECLKKTIYSRPSHKGGRSCPFCRRRIKEIVRFCDNAIYPQYGYAIKADCFST